MRQLSTYWLSKPCGVSRRFWIAMRAGGAKQCLISCEIRIRMASHSGEEILLGNRVRQPCVVLDERGDELVQPALEDLGHARALEFRVHRARLPLRDAAPPVVARQRIQRPV